MDAVCDPSVETVVVMTSSQTGKTETLLNVVGYHISHDPSPMLLLQPTLEMAEAWSKDRLAPMLRDTPALKGKVKDPRTRDSGNTLRHKIFPGGHISMSGANSPASLASRPIRIVLCDEIDRYPVSAGTEGDPVNLAKKRSTTFWNRKTVLTSTPTVKGQSRIEKAYNGSDRRRYHVPCPSCGQKQIMKWANVRWEKDQPGTARYYCESCNAPWTDSERWGALRGGEWRAEAPFTGVAGFHLNELYSPWVRLTDTVSNFLEATKNGAETLKTWINTSLGETWEEQGEHADEAVIHARCEPYPAEVPEGVLLLTAGVDIQTETKSPRLEVGIYGWGEGEECWLIDYLVLYGDPFRVAVWNDLDACLTRPYLHESGSQMTVAATCVDSGDGNVTETVYRWCRPRRARGVYPVKGRGGDGIPLLAAPRVMRPSGAMLYAIGVDEAKAVILSRLQSVLQPGPGYMHFPTGNPMVGEEFFAQLTGEQRGWERGKLVWKQRRMRVEALDVAVMALAAMRIRRPNWPALAAQRNAPGARPEPPIKPARRTGFGSEEWSL